MAFTKEEFAECLDKLKLSQIEAARLLSVTPRTINRWVSNPHEISGPAEQALKGWLRLQHYNLPWRPDMEDIISDEHDSILINSIKNTHCDITDNKLKGMNFMDLPWQVDFVRQIAVLETWKVYFCISEHEDEPSIGCIGFSGFDYSLPFIKSAIVEIKRQQSIKIKMGLGK